MTSSQVSDLIRTAQWLVSNLKGLHDGKAPVEACPCMGCETLRRLISCLETQEVTAHQMEGYE